MSGFFNILSPDDQLGGLHLSQISMEVEDEAGHILVTFSLNFSPNMFFLAGVSMVFGQVDEMLEAFQQALPRRI